MDFLTRIDREKSWLTCFLFSGFVQKTGKSDIKVTSNWPVSLDVAQKTHSKTTSNDIKSDIKPTSNDIKRSSRATSISIPPFRGVADVVCDPDFLTGFRGIISGIFSAVFSGGLA
ncbi:hypothetical protein [Endozoicomonas sp. SCSIO W0465]|uniref:hypothetical protein n=1 Tax=Endozoicomonas sp. SCSIO W0465 TaxID=2918516 RepID=UPI002074C2B2|nr:hypothetical protein [Endozoicomonas sp. SCSIO W0465]USE34590.1 hypothetical protein MJO57_20945 [Endozoicomonas sp. SCSIO W0465]